MPPVAGTGGRPVGLLLGFANMLLAAYEATAPRAVVIGLDARTPSYRHELLPGYQGQRPPFPEDLTEQLDRIPELAAAFGFYAVKEVPYEADDVLAAAVAAEERRGGEALVLTSDRDSFQLVSGRTSILMPPARAGSPLVRVGRDEVVERYGVRPDQVVDLIALRGDPSDNIPGARGVGPKTAAELLRRFGTLEGVIEHADELSNRQRLAVRGAASDLLRYREVARMQPDAGIPDVDDRPFDAARASAWARDAGLARLAERLAPG